MDPGSDALLRMVRDDASLASVVGAAGVGEQRRFTALAVNRYAQ